MKLKHKIIFIIIIIFFLLSTVIDSLFSNPNLLMDGDIIFQKSKSMQASALFKATGSDITHVGVIFFYNGKPYVIEALNPVKKTPYNRFVKRYGNGTCIVKRLSNRNEFTEIGISVLRQKCETFIGRKYDLLFRWSDDKIYCSELVWKAYRNALGIELGTLQKINDFNLSSSEVKRLMKQRGMDKQSMNETVITPVSIFNDTRLITVKVE